MNKASHYCYSKTQGNNHKQDKYNPCSNRAYRREHKLRAQSNEENTQVFKGKAQGFTLSNFSLILPTIFHLLKL